MSDARRCAAGMLLALLALSGCMPRPSPMAPRPVVDGAFSVRGTEPFWAVDIRPQGITYQRLDQERLAAPNPGMTQEGGKRVWSAIAGGRTLKVTLSETGACSDGMSDLVYPYAAEVIIGSETLRGCAFEPSEKPSGAR